MVMRNIHCRSARDTDLYDSKRMLFKYFILLLTLATFFVNPAHGLQSNIHVPIPPAIDTNSSKDFGLSAGYVRLDGEGIGANGIDLNIITGRKISDSIDSHVTLGAALLFGETDTATSKLDFSSAIYHLSFYLEYKAMKTPSSSLAFFAGIPFSYGNTIVEGIEDVTMYNFLAGLQGGVRLRVNAGDYVVSPWIMGDMMGGYGESYNGNVAYDNLDSGGIPMFYEISTGLQIRYVPLDLSFSGMYQKTFGSGENDAMESLSILVGFSL